MIPYVDSKVLANTSIHPSEMIFFRDSCWFRQESIRFAAYQIMAISTLANANEHITSLNYHQFVSTMAQMVQKYRQ